MSILANFDLVFEITADALLRSIESSAGTLFGGQSIEPPFEYDLEIAYIIVEELTLEFPDQQTVNLIINFDDSSITSFITVDSLDGQIIVGIPIINTANDLPALDLSQVKVTIDFSGPSINKIKAAGLPVDDPGDPLSVDILGANAIKGLISAQKISLGTIFNDQITVIPGTDGHLYTGSICSNPTLSLQLAKAEAHGIVDGNTGQPFLAIFGTVLNANTGNGNASLKTTTAIPTGDDFAFSISAEIIQQFLFCPGIGCILSQVPPPCGTGQTDLGGGVSLTKISLGLNNGFADLAGSIYMSKTCVTATADVHARVMFTVNNGYISLTPEFDPVNPNVSIDGWCWLIAALGAGPIGLIVVASVQSTLQSFGTQITTYLQDLVSKLALGGLFENDYGMVDQVHVSQECLTVGIESYIALPPQRTPSMSLSGSFVAVGETPVTQPGGSTQGTLTIPSGCMAGTYTYTEFDQQIQATYTAMPVLLGRPLDLQWYLTVGGNTIQLPNTSGTLQFENVDTYYELSSMTINQTVHIDYTISTDSIDNDTIQLRNRPEEGMFDVSIDARAIDPTGRIAEASVSGFFQGELVLFHGGYYAQLEGCVRAWVKEMRDGIYSPVSTLKPWVPVNYPAPDALRQFMYSVATARNPLADQLLTFARLAHGSSFFRMLFSIRYATEFSWFRIASANQKIFHEIF